MSEAYTVSVRFHLDREEDRRAYAFLQGRGKKEYLDTENAAAYLPRVLSEVLEGKLEAFGNRIGGLLFKLAVNDGMLTCLIASGADIDQAVLDKLRVQCVNEAKQIHGVIELKDVSASLRGD